MRPEEVQGLLRGLLSKLENQAADSFAPGNTRTSPVFRALLFTLSRLGLVNSPER